MKVLLLAAALATYGVAVAQTSEGKIVYEQKINSWKYIPPEREQMKSFIPEYQTTKMELSFKGNTSLYKPVPTDEAELPTTEGGGGGGFRMMRFGVGNSESFKNYETGIATDIRELGPKKYLLDDTLNRLAWKLSADTMTIMGHLCHKATAVQKGGVMAMAGQRMGGGGQPGGGGPVIAGSADSSRRRGNNGNGFANNLTRDQNVVAWYADDIASPAGPDVFYGLPGVIMKLDVDDGFMVYTPLELSPTAGTVKAPSSGKKITREEYRKMMQEQMQNMRNMGRNGGGFRMGGPM
jgi:GLPGLI family protein